MQDNSEIAPPTIAEMLALEEVVWRALVTGDRNADHDMLLPEFLGVYPDGFAGRDDHSGQLEAGPSVASYDLSKARLLPVGQDHVMLCYLARFRRVGVRENEAMYVSSLWQRGPEGWRNLFSQDTPVGPGVP
ncbi:nuclear transport factor 2 family protein [Alisedimentitalea sp. MJ-SS2]|uniref:nuclear transport factor 2 family protein n=1 Tax=Aliisedimentitalea sp. MJ-SS2 TaxID=3049795 RepID=UPI002913DA46|nr:nuclear transport factor 2 family protein [Alisedimentitalea sp. MJ-SS2]MDU8926469.1 nuclear transport factor 2 family protein [Alisedimentitalea sp. MJ-SS2]